MLFDSNLHHVYFACIELGCFTITNGQILHRYHSISIDSYPQGGIYTTTTISIKKKCHYVLLQEQHIF
jgi:hypothetical protein